MLRNDNETSDANVNDAEIARSRRRRQGILASYAYTFAQVVVNLVYVPLLLSTIGKTEYGLYQTVGAIMSYIVSVNGILSAGVSRYYSMYKAEGDERMMESTLALAKRIYWGISAVAVLVILLLIPLMREAYSETYTASQLDECSWMLVVLSVNMVVTFNNSVNIAAINANERFVFLKGTQLATLVLQPILIIAVGRIIPNAVTITLVVLSMNVLCSLLQRVYAQGFLGTRYTFHGWDRSLLRGLLGFSATVVLVTVADQLFWNSGKLLIGYFAGADLVAVFGVGAQVYNAYMSAGLAISGVFFQRVSELVHRRHDMAAVSGLFARVGRVSFAVLFLVLGGFLVLGRDFIDLWAGPGFEDAYWVALAVMIPLTVDLIQNLGLTILQVLDKYSFRGFIYLALSLVNLIVSALMIPRWGVIGAAVSSGACMFVGNGIVMNWYYSAKAGIDVKLFWDSVLRCAIPLICVVLFAVASRALLPVESLSWTGLIAFGVIYLAVYVAVYWGIASSEWERAEIRSALSRR